MPGWYEKNYWKTGFKSRLYDFLTPEDYFESMRQTAALVAEKKEGKIWDAGCGSGLLLEFLQRVLRKRVNYFGTDLLFTGLEKLKLRACELGVSSNATFLQNDITVAPPFSHCLLPHSLNRQWVRKWEGLLAIHAITVIQIARNTVHH